MKGGETMIRKTYLLAPQHLLGADQVSRTSSGTIRIKKVRTIRGKVISQSRYFKGNDLNVKTVKRFYGRFDQHS